MLPQSCLASTVKGGPLVLRSTLKRAKKMTLSAVFTYILFVAVIQLSQAGPLRLQKRAAFYIANETACVVDNLVYSNGDPIPTDDPCEACKCRPPGFACVLKDCPKKPGCRAVRRTGECCPEYVCGCEHNGRMYRDGDEIRDSKNPCYTCHCQGSSIACAFVDCFFRVDCAPEYVQDKCCPEYNHCATAIDLSNATASYTTASIEESVHAITTELPLIEESKVEYVEPEESRSSGTSEEETVENREQVLPAETLLSDVAGVIHRIAITVEEELNSETTPEYQTTEDKATTEYETTKGETTFKSEATTSQTTASFVADENSSPITELNDEISLEKQTENQPNLLKAELDVITSESEEGEKPEDIILISSIDNIPEVNSELFSTTESQDEDIQTNEATTKSSFQTDFSVTEIAVTIEEIEKETNEIKKFRSLHHNGTEDELKSENTENGSESTEVKSDSSDEDISDKSKNSDTEEQTQSTTTEIVSEFKEQTESETKSFKTTETSLLSVIPEDKIADFLISLKKTSTKVPNTDVPNSDSISTTISFENLDSSEINVDVATTKLKKETIGMDEQETPSTIASNDAEPSLVKAFNDLVDSNENRESVILIEEISTSQTSENVDLSTNKNAESTLIQTSTAGQTTQQFGIVDHSTESITESYTSTENTASVTISNDKQDDNAATPLTEEIQ